MVGGCTEPKAQVDDQSLLKSWAVDKNSCEVAQPCATAACQEADWLGMCRRIYLTANPRLQLTNLTIVNLERPSACNKAAATWAAVLEMKTKQTENAEDAQFCG